MQLNFLSQISLQFHKIVYNFRLDIVKLIFYATNIQNNTVI